MNWLLTASRLLADLPLTKVDGRQIEFTVRATSCAGDQVVELTAPVNESPPLDPDQLV